MSWLFIGISSLVLAGISSTGDKIILRKAITDPIANIFLLSISGLFAIVLVPLGFRVPAYGLVAQALGIGVLFFFGMLFYFFALKRADASAILPVYIGWLPIAALGFSALFIPHVLSGAQLLPLGLMVLGTVIIAKNGVRERVPRRALFHAFASAVLIGASDVLSKKMFLETGFVSGFILIRIGGALGSLLILAVPAWRARISGHPSVPAGAAFISNRILAGLGSLMFFYALSLGSPPILEALRGVSLATIFFLTAACSRFAPRILHESFTRTSFIQKLAGIICIGTAIALL